MSIQLSTRPNILNTIHGFIRTAYSVPSQVAVIFADESPYTRQEYKDECDINTIMSRYQSTGELPHLNQSHAQYLDVTASLSFQESMNFVAEAQSMFNELPSAIRDRFYNDPGQFLDFCSNDANRVELAQMGLLSPEATSAALNPPIPTNPTAAPLKTPNEPPEAN